MKQQSRNLPPDTRYIAIAREYWGNETIQHGYIAITSRILNENTWIKENKDVAEYFAMQILQGTYGYVIDCPWVVEVEVHDGTTSETYEVTVNIQEENFVPTAKLK